MVQKAGSGGRAECVSKEAVINEVDPTPVVFGTGVWNCLKKPEIAKARSSIVRKNIKTKELAGKPKAERRWTIIFINKDTA